MHKSYFRGVDGTNIEWAQDRNEAFSYASEEAAEQVSNLLKLAQHLITPSDGGPRLIFRNFRVEPAGEHFVVCFDAEPTHGGEITYG